MAERPQSDGSRSRSGCITCRIRKKKCDEQRPVCHACCSRELVCYGFSVPAPTWYTSKASWREVRDSDEAKNLRTLAQTRYKMSRRVGHKTSSATTTSFTVHSAERDYRPRGSPQLLITSSLNVHQIFPPRFLLKTGVNIWQLRPETVWWDSTIRSLAPDPSSSSREETRLLMLFMDVIHPITHTFYSLGNSRDRSWMLQRLVSRQSLYCSALSISACFDYSLSQPPSINDIGICPKVRRLQSRAISELQAQIDEFALMNRTPVEDFIWAGVQILDVVSHLETLEIFSMLQGHWELHHQAARRILNHIEIDPMQPQRPISNASVIETTLLRWQPSDTRRRSLELSLCNFIWIDVLATSTFGALPYIPCAFDYLGLLSSGVIRPQEVMGCHGWIMAVISKISRLEQWKLMQQDYMDAVDINAELVRQGTPLEDELKHGINRLEGDYNSANLAGIEEDMRLISIVWAYGALVLLRVTVLDISSDNFDVNQTFVNACLEKLEALPTRLVMRTSWPYTIAGSMASNEYQHARFRWILGKTMQEAQPPGISWKGLIVMEECWRLRKVQDGKRVGWREAMESLGARVILT